MRKVCLCLLNSAQNRFQSEFNYEIESRQIRILFFFSSLFFSHFFFLFLSLFFSDFFYFFFSLVFFLSFFLPLSKTNQIRCRLDQAKMGTISTMRRNVVHVCSRIVKVVSTKSMVIISSKDRDTLASIKWYQFSGCSVRISSFRKLDLFSYLLSKKKPQKKLDLFIICPSQSRPLQFSFHCLHY